jgi:hypothetical protein
MTWLSGEVELSPIDKWLFGYMLTWLVQVYLLGYKVELGIDFRDRKGLRRVLKGGRFDIYVRTYVLGLYLR